MFWAFYWAPLSPGVIGVQVFPAADEESWAGWIRMTGKGMEAPFGGCLWPGWVVKEVKRGKSKGVYSRASLVGQGFSNIPSSWGRTSQGWKKEGSFVQHFRGGRSVSGSLHFSMGKDGISLIKRNPRNALRVQRRDYADYSLILQKPLLLSLKPIGKIFFFPVKGLQAFRPTRKA